MSEPKHVDAEDVDGVPLEDEGDIDGIPIDDVDGQLSKLVNHVFVAFILNVYIILKVSDGDANAVLKFKPSKWETIDPDLVEAQGITYLRYFF